MTATHLVRFGISGQIGRFASSDATCYPRATRVILRTQRGLEVGQVLTSPSSAFENASSSAAADGAILRGMTVEDDLLEVRLEAMRDVAHRACQQRLDDLGLDAMLTDVEHLFDGSTLVFHFLGPTSDEIEAVTSELAEVYKARAEYESFVETLTHGCGPGCGTEQAEGGGCGSCSTGCAVASACSTSRRRA